MADRTEKTGERPFGRDAAELPHRDVRTGAPSDIPRDASAPPAAEGAPVRTEREVAAGEVLSPGGDRAEAAMRDAEMDAERDHGHTADHATSTPSGSAHAAVEVPKSGRSRKLLMGAVAAVVAIIVLMLLIPGEADATSSPLLTLVGGR